MFSPRSKTAGAGPSGFGSPVAFTLRFRHARFEDATSTAARRLDCSDVDLFHLHYRIERALGGSGIGTGYRFGQSDRRDLPPAVLPMYFSQFAGLMIARTPAMRRTQAEIIGRGIQIQNYAYAVHDETFESLIRRMEKEMHQKMDAATKACLRQSMIDPSKNPVVLPQEKTLSALKLADTLAPLFYRMKWSIMRAKHGFLITSDNPVVREVDPRTRHPFYGDHGFLNKTVEVSFPLSREILLLMSWSDAPRKEILERDAVDMANRSRAAHSDRYLYAHARHKHIQALADEFKDSRPNMSTEGFGPNKFAPVKVPRRSRK